MTAKIFFKFIIILSNLCDSEKYKLKDASEHFMYASIKFFVTLGYMLAGAFWNLMFVCCYRFFLDKDIKFVLGIIVLIIAIIVDIILEILDIKEIKRKNKIESNKAMVCLFTSYIIIILLSIILLSLVIAEYTSYFVTFLSIYLVDFILDYYRIRIVKKAIKVENELETKEV